MGVNLLRAALLIASRNTTVRHIVETAPVSRDVVRRFVAGTSVEDAVSVTAALIEAGLAVSLDRLGEDDRGRAGTFDGGGRRKEGCRSRRQGSVARLDQARQHRQEGLTGG